MTWGSIIKWIVGLVIIGISAYMLYEYVFGTVFKIPGLGDATVFEKYATCSLAICSNGVDGKQVDKVGCLDGGITGTNCTATCRRIADEWADTRDETFFDINGIPHFCGEQNYLEFDLDFSITVRSGQMQKRADPKWVCDASKLAGFIIPFSDELKNSRGDCIEFGTLKPEGGVLELDIRKLFEEDERRIGEACFDGFEEVTFTPLMPYSKPIDRVYPSGIYISDQIREASKNCVISASKGPVPTNTPASTPNGTRAWQKLFSDKRPLEILPECQIRNRDSEGPRKFRVWSEISINKPYLDIVPNALDALANKIYDDKNLGVSFTDIFFNARRDLSDIFGTISKNTKIAEDKIYQKFNSCALVVVDYADTKDDSLSFDSPVTIVSFEHQDIFPSLYTKENSLNMFFVESDSIDPTTASFSRIMYVESIDKEYSKAEPFLSDTEIKYSQPSVTNHNGKQYIAYLVGGDCAEEFLGFCTKEKTWDIGISSIDGTYTQRLETKGDQFAPEIISFDGKLYLFYHLQFKDFTQIFYRIGTVSQNSIEWMEEKQIAFLEGRSTSFPSASATKDSIVLAYSFSDNRASKMDSAFYSSVGVVMLSTDMELIHSSVISEGEFVTKTDSDDTRYGINSGFAEVLVDDKKISVFFDRGTGNIEDENFQRRVHMSNYLGEDRWSRPTVIPGIDKSLMASPAILNGRLVIAYSNLEDTLDLKMIQESPNDKSSSDSIASADKKEQDDIESFMLNFEPVTEEPTVFSGNVMFSSENPKTRNLDLKLTVDAGISKAFLVSSFPRKAIINKDGTFEFEHTFNKFDDGKPRTFTLTIQYNEKEIETREFEAGGS